jgi:hypothetical protein
MAFTGDAFEPDAIGDRDRMARYATGQLRMPGLPDVAEKQALRKDE